jgi:hypothetical protein
MLDLNDKRWETFKGGYKVSYNASIPLKVLERTEDPARVEQILQEFWQELHHQGDVDVASYLALPHLIRIAKEKQLRNWDIPALVAVIEVQRHINNPPIPKEFQAEYEREIKDIIDVIKLNQDKKWDQLYATSATAAIAAVNGQIGLARVIIELEDEDLANKFEKFMERYDEFEEWLDENGN